MVDLNMSLRYDQTLSIFHILVSLQGLCCGETKIYAFLNFWSRLNKWESSK